MVKANDQYAMIKEITEEPEAVRATLNLASGDVRSVANSVCQRDFQVIYLSGSGTSYHAGMIGQYVLSSLANVMTSSLPASEFSSWVPVSVARRALLIAISQSGESADMLAASSAARQKGMSVIAITNTAGSTLARLADFVLLTRAGDEKAVTATKSYVTTLVMLYMLALELGKCRVERNEQVESFGRQLERAPDLLAETMSLTSQVEEFAKALKEKSVFFVLGSKVNFATALEAALKLKESCNLYAEGFAAREFLHGPMQLVDERTPVFMVATPKELPSLLPLSQSFRRFKAPVVWVSGGEAEVQGAETLLRLPVTIDDLLSPLFYIIPFQLFAYHSSVARGLNPDKPDKLRKVVR